MRLRTIAPLTLAGALVLLLALPAAAGRKPKRQDGTLSLRDGRGMVMIVGRGSVIGRVDAGDVLVVDRTRFDANVPVVRGGRLLVRRQRKIVRSGKSIRFRLTGGAYRLKLVGVGLHLSAVGRGRVIMDGDERYADTGLYSLNGGEFLPVPYERTTLQLAAPPPPPPG